MVGQKKRLESPMPTVDEGWWASVLTEETRRTESLGARSSVSSSEARENVRVPPAEKKKISNWSQVKDLYLRDQIINLVVTGHNRGGLLVEGNDINGFVPFSHLIELAGKTDTVHRDRELESFVGRTLRLKVIECVPEDGRVVFSERAAQTESGKRAELFLALQPGQQVTGVVTNVTDFGVFVDLGGVEGLIHISELSWGRVSHPNQYVKMGDSISVQVLDLAPERCRVALSLKRMQKNPWEHAQTEFPVGKILPATVTSLLSFGAFARLEAGVEGLIHASEIPEADRKPIKEILAEGERVQVRVLHVDASHQRLGLSMKLEELQ